MTRTMRYALALAATVFAACSDSTGPKPGLLYVSVLGTPAARSVRFQLVGKQTNVAALTGTTYRIFTAAGSGDTLNVAVIATQGQTLSGSMVQVSVPDVAQLATYKITVIQVALPDYSLGNPANYTPHVLSTPN